MNLYSYFKKCLNVKYTNVENDGSYYTEKVGNTLYIYLECSNGKNDWISNFNFFPVRRRNIFSLIWGKIKQIFEAIKKSANIPCMPYKDMKKSWYCHRGFLKVWKSIEMYISSDIMNKDIKNIITIGYSHGAALAILCHEYIWFNRPDLRNSIEGYGFGCPRIYFGIRRKSILKRWERFEVIRNINDIVTHLPPVIFGFSHVGRLVKIGEKGLYSCFDAHRPENILKELKKLTKQELKALEFK